MAGEQESEVQKARDAGFNLLSARARTVYELREKLRRKEFSDGLIDQVVADFQRLKLLDDREFARNWVESRRRNRPAATAKLALELRRKGVAGEVIDEVLTECGGELDTSETAADILRRQGWRYAGLEEMKAKRRMLGFLARRGYGQETARKAIEQIWKELQRNDLEGN